MKPGDLIWCLIATPLLVTFVWLTVRMMLFLNHTRPTPEERSLSPFLEQRRERRMIKTAYALIGVILTLFVVLTSQLEPVPTSETVANSASHTHQSR
jgi:hypothetical protein